MAPSEVSRVMRQLRDAGIKLSVSHTRRYRSGPRAYYWISNRDRLKMKDKYGLVGPPDERGGYVRIVALLPDGQEVETEAHCSEHDQFNGRVGTAVALGRLVKILRGMGVKLSATPRESVSV